MRGKGLCPAGGHYYRRNLKINRGTREGEPKKIRYFPYTAKSHREINVKYVSTC